MKPTVLLCILHFFQFALTTQLTLISKDGVEVEAHKESIIRPLVEKISFGRQRKGIKENKEAKEFYKELLRNLQTHKSSSHARIEGLSVEDAAAINKYISNFLESQIQGENELHLDPNNIPIVLNLLSAHQQQFTNVNSNQISIPSIQALAVPDPNEYAQVAYIPALHGTQSSSFPVNEDTLLSHISLPQESTLPGLTSNATLETDTRITLSGVTATASSIAASLTSCRASMLCSLFLAGAVTAATVGAVAFPVLVAGPLLDNRKKRSTEHFDLHQDNIIDIINNYNTNHYPLMNPISELPELFYEKTDTDVKPNNAQKLSTESGNNNGLNKNLLHLQEFNYKPENETGKAVTNDRENGNDNDANIASEGGPYINEESHNFNNTSYNSRSASQLNDELQKAERGFQITTNFTLEHRIPGVNKINSTKKDELTSRLRSSLYEFFSQFDHLSEKLNISTHYEKKSNDSNINNEEQSILGILDYYLKNNSTRLTATSLNNPLFKNSSAISKDSFINPETPNIIPEDLFKTISSTHLFQNLILNNHRQEFKVTTSTSATTTQPPTTLPPISSNVNKDEDVRKDLLQLLSDYINIKQSQSTPDKGNSYSSNILEQLFQKVQLTEKPPLLNSVVIPSFPTYQSIQPEAAQPNTPIQNVIPINTINSILQNPPANTQNLNLILTKLPTLITEPNKQQFQRHPIISNQQQYTQFSPTVFQNTHPSSGPYHETPSAIHHRPPTASLGNTFTQTATGKPQGLSPEIGKFYGLLCKAILEPDVPLNKVTAYIAEKCLVMRFTGILKT